MVTKNTQRLAEVGPIDPRTGFPLWYEDATGRRLELVWQPGDDLAPVDLDAESGQLRGLPFPGEAFYMSAESRFTAGTGRDEVEIRVILALEATFGGTGDVADGQQIVFGRIRFRIDDAVPDQLYRLTHPYGVVEGRASNKGRVFVTEDIGVTPLAFSEALSGQIAPFLVWDADAPAGYVGDGQTSHRVTGSPFGTNYALVEGPGIGAAGDHPDPDDPGNRDKVYSDLFVLQGRIATINGADVPRAVYSRNASGDVVVDVFARSIPEQTLSLSLDGVEKTDRMPGGTGTSRTYFARVDAGAAVPQTVSVKNTNDPVVDPPLPATEVDVTDAVQISRADYDTADRTLTVVATSSDEQTPPNLELTGDGLVPTPLGAAGSATVNGVEAPPLVVTVTSTRPGPKGGSDTRTVSVAG